MSEVRYADVTDQPFKARVWREGGIIWPWKAEYPFLPICRDPWADRGPVLMRSQIFTTQAHALGWVLAAMKARDHEGATT